MRHRMLGAALLGALTWGGLAGAQDPDRHRARDEATARMLFDDARALMRRGEYAQACPKLEAARKLYESSGVLLNLGDCYERTGRTASAFAAFGDAATTAARQDRAEDEAEARRRQVGLEPKLSRLVVRVAKDSSDLLVKDGDRPLERATWGVALPVDPGPHVVVEEAPGFARWSTSVEVPPGGKRVEVELPELKPLPGAASPAGAAKPTDAPHAPTEAAASFWTTRREVTVALAGVGVAAFAASGALVGLAKSKYAVATRETAPARHDDSATALAEANAATGLACVGGALAASAALLFLIAPAARASVGTDGRGFYVTGRF